MPDLSTPGQVKQVKKILESLPKPPTVEELKLAEMQAESALSSAARSGAKVETLKAEISRLKARASREKALVLERARRAERKVAAADLELEALRESIEKDALLIYVLQRHYDKGEATPNCRCLVCRMHAKVKSIQENVDEWKAKAKKAQADLREFQGPPSKKRKKGKR